MLVLPQSCSSCCMDCWEAAAWIAGRQCEWHGALFMYILIVQCRMNKDPNGWSCHRTATAAAWVAGRQHKRHGAFSCYFSYFFCVKNRDMWVLVLPQSCSSSCMGRWGATQVAWCIFIFFCFRFSVLTTEPSGCWPCHRAATTAAWVAGGKCEWHDKFYAFELCPQCGVSLVWY